MKTNQSSKGFMIKAKYYFALIVIVLLTVVLPSCKKYLDIETPRNEVVRENVFSSDASAISALHGIYGRLFATSLTYHLTLRPGLSSDELTDFEGGIAREFFENSLNPTNANVLSIWSRLYQSIYAANALIEGLTNSTGVTSTTKKQVEGEAKFIRAFCHFYLVNLWGDIPLATTTDYLINSQASRTPTSQVYEKIIEDLVEAKTLLTVDYSFASNQRGRPNKSAASAFLARVYLYTQQWQKAEDEATNVINNTSLYNLESNLNNIPLVNSKESIWQLRSTYSTGGVNTWFGQEFILVTTPARVALSNNFVNTAFEVGDPRKTNWIDSLTVDANTYFFTKKYKVRAGSGTPPITEAEDLFRLAEQYLIRAEASAQQNNIAGAMSDINTIRNRAFGVPNLTPANDKASLLLAIEQERKVELFCESGHRWLDLKRTGRADAILGPIKAENWQTTDQLYPIPQSEMDKAPNLRPQTPGY